MKKKIITLLLLLTFVVFKNYAQKGFRFLNNNDKKEHIKFRLINNLIVIPIEINGKELFFILDSGVNKTIIFNLSENESIGLSNPKKIALRGLGGGEAVDALLSKNNKLSLKGIVGANETIYVILKDYFDLSSKMGTTIHGIIGYNLLKNFIIKINYRTKTLHFYNAKTYTYKKCRNCEILPIQFYQKKPFVDVKVQLDTIGEKLTDVKLLIDSGGSDAVWLFEHTKKNIVTPKRHFHDILGEGLSGSIFGNRSRIPKLKLGNYEIENPTVSMLDSISTYNARKFKQRNGSIGGNVLKRFKVWLDYPNKQIMLKKNGSFKNGFNYNMSGLEVIYSGKQLVKEEISQKVKTSNRRLGNQNSIPLITRYTFKFKPSFVISKVVKNSAADKAGLLKDDEILSLNGKRSYEYKLTEIYNSFQEKDHKKIRITINRKGKKMKFEFRLEKKF